MMAQVRAESELKKALAAEDAPATLRLVLHDAATYDFASGTGGLNGSIVQRSVAPIVLRCCDLQI